jgi:hypothetical protein
MKIAIEESVKAHLLRKDKRVITLSLRMAGGG